MKRTAEKMDALGKVVRGLAISIVVLLAAAAITEHVSTLPSAQASPSVQAQADAPARAADAKPSIPVPDAQSGSLAIHEAHSDGGYSYWVEQQGQP